MKLKNNLFSIYYLILTYLVSFWTFLKEYFLECKKPTNLENQTGKIALITGGGKGIGFEVSKQLLALNMSVVIVGIYEDQIDGVRELEGMADTDRVYFLECDLSSLIQVRNLAENFKKLNLPLNLLVNNAGVMFCPRHETPEGHEYHWVVNYLSHFLLTHLLFTHLSASTSRECPSRIVNLSSVLHYPASIDFDDIEGRKSYSAEFAYGQSKLAMLLFAKSLNRYCEEQGISIISNSVHPAVTFTGLYKNMWWTQKLSFVLKKLLRTPKDGSQTVVHACASSDVSKGGDYYESCQIKTPSREAQLNWNQEKLWEYTLNKLGINRFGC